MISNKYKCIYVHIPKCAGNSIEYAFGHDRNRKDILDINEQTYTDISHNTATEIKEHHTNEEQWSSYFKFAIVRNPFDRLVSSYNFVCEKTKYRKFRDNMPFKDFVFRKGVFGNTFSPSIIIKKRDKCCQRMPSHRYIYDENDNLLVDYVGKFENLQKEWDFICKQLKVKLELGHHNECSPNNKHYRDYYDEETKRFVTEACKKDLEIFGYEY